MAKGNITICLDIDLLNKIRTSGDNISSIINTYLNEYYLNKNPNKLEVLNESKEEIELRLMELEEKMNQIKNEEESRNNKIKEQESEKDYYKRINDYINQMSDEEKQIYLNGIKEHKWGGIVEYAKIKLS
jgi:chromosome segregation ATPase